MSLQNLKNRSELAAEFARLGYRIGAEIGVLRAEYSEVLFRQIPGLRLYLVDPWKVSRNHRDQEKLEGYFIHAQRRVRNFDAVFMRMTSLAAAETVPDRALDFVYIDALHDYEHVLEDLNAWVPKVRAGGAVSGHDWGHQGVTKAVQEFTEKHNITELFTTQPAPETDWYPSWCWIKNEN